MTDSVSNNCQESIVITGGGRGIGKAIARQLAKNYCVMLVGRTERDLIATCSEIHAAGGTAAYYAGDAAAPKTAQAVMKRIAELGWTLQGVVCNAGIGKSSPTHELDEALWHSVVNVNLHASFYFAKAALPIFLQQKAGTLCFISSIAGVKAYAYEAAYVASKHAVVGLAQSLALEYGKHGITSVAICPSFVEGAMTTRTIKGLAKRRGIAESEARTVIERTNPQRRIIPEEEIATIVDFVCSNKVPSLSGSPIIVSGGA